jgi:hypothetical protein
MGATVTRSAHHTSTSYRFAPIPEALLYADDVSDKALRVYGALMRHGLDPSSCYPSHARIGELIGCAARSIQRPLRELEAAGWIERVRRIDPDTGQRITDGFHVHTANAQMRAPTALVSVEGSAQDHRAPERVEGEQENESQPERKDPLDARSLVTRVWERADPKPATPFIAAVKIAEALLRAGHSRDDVGRAMLAAPTISTRTIEIEIARHKPATGRPIIEDREGESGRIDL